VALAGGLQGWLFRRTNPLERGLLIVAGLMLVYPAPLFDYIGFGLVVFTAMLQKLRHAQMNPAAG
jgi:TRAP-type uncharacterized transport system fused permease subunit